MGLDLPEVPTTPVAIPVNGTNNSSHSNHATGDAPPAGRGVPSMFLQPQSHHRQQESGTRLQTPASNNRHTLRTTRQQAITEPDKVKDPYEDLFEGLSSQDLLDLAV